MSERQMTSKEKTDVAVNRILAIGSANAVLATAGTAIAESLTYAQMAGHAQTIEAIERILINLSETGIMLAKVGANYTDELAKQINTVEEVTGPTIN